MAKKENVIIGYDKASKYLNNLKTFRGMPQLTKDQRAGIRTIVDKIEDLMRATRTKVGALQEEYKELKSHKSIIESEEKAKKILRDCDAEINTAIKDFNLEIDWVNLVPVTGLFAKCDNDDETTSNEKKAYWPLYVELEGVFLTDDGGEPKRGGGGGNG
jgi:hypothetical protein